MQLVKAREDISLSRASVTTLMVIFYLHPKRDTYSPTYDVNRNHPDPGGAYRPWLIHQPPANLLFEVALARTQPAIAVSAASHCGNRPTVAG